MPPFIRNRSEPADSALRSHNEPARMSDNKSIWAVTGAQSSAAQHVGNLHDPSSLTWCKAGAKGRVGVAPGAAVCRRIELVLLFFCLGVGRQCSERWLSARRASMDLIPSRLTL